MFRTYLIGRAKLADMTIDDPSVSRAHAEFTITQSGRFFYVDRATTHGSFIIANDQKQPLKQAFVKPDELLSIGTYRIKAGELARHLQATNKFHDNIAFESISFTPCRNAGSGAVEPKHR